MVIILTDISDVKSKLKKVMCNFLIITSTPALPICFSALKFQSMFYQQGNEGIGGRFSRENTNIFQRDRNWIWKAGQKWQNE